MIAGVDSIQLLVLELGVEYRVNNHDYYLQVYLHMLFQSLMPQVLLNLLNHRLIFVIQDYLALIFQALL